MAAWIEFQGPGFRMEFPSNWRVLATPQFQAIFFSSVIADQKRANLTVALQNKDRSVTAKQLTDMLNRLQATSYPDFKVINECDKSTNDVSIIERTLHWRNPTSAGIVFQHQACFVQGDQACILTGSRPDDLSDDVKTSLDTTFLQMFKSFTFHSSESID